MKTNLKASGIVLCCMMPVLLFSSCHSASQKSSANTHSVDTIVIKQMQFIPAELTVEKGDTVVWINKDIVDHNITEEGNHLWSSDTLKVAHSWKKAIADSSHYFCSIHPSMKGRLVLK